MEITKLLGRYSQQQGLFGRERGLVTNVISETWGFLNKQFANLFGDSGSGLSTRVRVYRVTKSELVVKAARIKMTCIVWQFETVAIYGNKAMSLESRLLQDSDVASQRYHYLKPFGRTTLSMWCGGTMSVNLS
jgi:hypothetical protein